MTHAQSTRCPHCHTAFRVTPEQLAAARGSVRCGSCLQVFNARDYIVDEELPGLGRLKEVPRHATAESLARRPVETGTVAPASRQTSHVLSEPEDGARRFVEDDTDLLFGDNEADDELALFDDADGPADLETPQARPAARENEHPEIEPEELEFSDSFMSLDSATPPLPDTEARDAAHERSAQANADDSWALDMLADLEREEERQLPSSHQDMSLQSETSPEGDAKPDSSLFNTHKPARSSAALEPERSNLEAAFSLQEMNDLADHSPAVRHRRPWLMVATIALVLVAAGQLLWWERARLSQQPGLNSLYSLACQRASCDFLQTGPNASAVRALSSVLRPLPDGRMRLDAVFVNRGDQPVPFPLLVLELENAQGEVTADGLFAPDDYVGGELQPTDPVPPGRPVSISLNINRPVDDLSNFRLSFHY